MRHGGCQVTHQDGEERAGSVDTLLHAQCSHKATPNLSFNYPSLPLPSLYPVGSSFFTSFLLAWSPSCSLSRLEARGPVSLCSSSIWHRRTYLQSMEGKGRQLASHTLDSSICTSSYTHIIPPGQLLPCWASLNGLPLMRCRWGQGKGTSGGGNVASSIPGLKGTGPRTFTSRHTHKAAALGLSPSSPLSSTQACPSLLRLLPSPLPIHGGSCSTCHLSKETSVMGFLHVRPPGPQWAHSYMLYTVTHTHVHTLYIHKCVHMFTHTLHSHSHMCPPNSTHILQVRHSHVLTYSFVSYTLTQVHVFIHAHILKHTCNALSQT